MSNIDLAYFDSLRLPDTEWFDEDLDLTDDINKVSYISCEHLNQHSLIGMSNYLTLTKQYEDIATVWCRSGYQQALLPISTSEQYLRAKDVFQRLSNYPVLSEANLEKLTLEKLDAECAEYHKQGYDRGYSIGSTVDFVEPQEEDELSWMERQLDAAYDAEQNNRDFSPFEFTANELNQHEFSEHVWEAFDDGINEGIIAAINERFVEN